MDTNVLYAGQYSKKGASFAVLEALHDGKWMLVLSQTVLTEYEEVLMRSLTELEITLAQANSILDDLCNMAEEFATSDQWMPILLDAVDEAFAQLASEGRCECLVTHNIRHFKPLSEWGIRVIAPREFLATLQSQP
jgi:predicted nucleic acid-binding protein